MTGGMAFEGLNNLGHSGTHVDHHPQRQRPRSYAPTVSKLGESLARLRLNPSYVRNRARLDQLLHEVPLVGEHAREGRRRRARRAAGDVRAAGLLRDAGRALHGPVRRPRHRRRWSGRCATPPSTTGRSSSTCSPRRAGATRRPRPTRSSASTTCPTPSRAATPRPSPRRSSRRPSTGPTWWPSPRPCPTPPACCRSRSGSPTGSSTSASPSSTRSRPPPAWPWAGCGRSSPSTRRSSARAFDQVNLDVALHGQPVVFCIDRAGITGDDGASHHGVLDLVLLHQGAGHDGVRPVVVPASSA